MSAIIIENDALDALLHLTAHILEVTVDRASRFIAEVFNRKAFSYVKLHRLTSDALIEAGSRTGIRVVTSEANELLEAFRLYMPSTPLCTDCRKPAVFLDPSDGVYKEAPAHTPCPHCNEVLRPSTIKTHVTLWWSGRTEAIGTRHCEGAEPLPETDEKIRGYLGRHGRDVHRFIEMALERELAGVEEPLCRFLNALFLCPDLRTFKNGHNRLGIIAALADSDFVTRVGEGNVKLIGIKARERWWDDDEVLQSDAPVALSSRRGSIPPFRAKPPLGKMERMPPDPPRVFQSSPSAAWSPPSHDSGVASVVLLYPSSPSQSDASRRNKELILELRMHLAPLFAAHGIALWDRDHSDFPEEEIRGKIDKSALIICLTSPYFFNEAIDDDSVIGRAVHLMNAWRCADKTVVIRLQHHADITEGYFNGLQPVSQRTLSSIADGRDEAWIAIVDQIRRKLRLTRVDRRLDSAMVPEQLQKAASNKLRNLSEIQFREVVEHLEMSWRDFSPKSSDARVYALLDHCLRHGRFIELRQAIDQATRL